MKPSNQSIAEGIFPPAAAQVNVLLAIQHVKVLSRLWLARAPAHTGGRWPVDKISRKKLKKSSMITS
jgi:hypothetical protein